MRYKLTKLKDNKCNGNHPNGINEGLIFIGFADSPPVINYPFIMTSVEDIHYFYTSTVTQINDDGTFETLNSTYELKLLD